MTNLRISIVCPVRNVEKYIEETVQSVLSQTYKDWELLIMDGASTDNTANIVGKYSSTDPRVKFYSEPDESPWEATDRGIDRAQGELLCVIAGQDGFLDRDWLSKCAAAFNSDPEIALVWGFTRGMQDDGTLENPHHVSYSHLLRKESFVNSLQLIFWKASRFFLDLLFGNVARKKILIKKIFSKTAVMRATFLASRSFPGGKIPQKEQWFSYWLKTGFVFPDQAMCVSKKVYVSCAPRYPKGTRMVNHMTDFNFNFNSRGYLAHCIPTLATFGRMHPGNSGDRVADELYGEQEKYLRKVLEFRSAVMSGRARVVFVDRKGYPISRKGI